MIIFFFYKNSILQNITMRTSLSNSLQKTIMVFIFVLIQEAISENQLLPFHKMEIFGNGSLGYYYTNLYVGKPPQRQSVIIDTGSSLLTFPCDKCTNCSKKHIDQIFQLGKSQTVKILNCASQTLQCKKTCKFQNSEPCHFRTSYAQGSSLQGFFLQDIVQVQSDAIQQGIRLEFGCTTSETKLFLQQQANGIIGLGYKGNELFGNIYKAHNPFNNQKKLFTLCLAKNGGRMNIGSVGQILSEESPLISSFGSSAHELYNLINMTSIKVGNQSLYKKGDNPGVYGIFMDSGSTYSYFPRTQYKIFQQSIKAACLNNTPSCLEAKGQSTLCFHLPKNGSLFDKSSRQQFQAQVESIFPTISFEIENSSKPIIWKPTDYFFLRDQKNRQICSGVSSLDRYLLGANWMANKNIIFKLDEKIVEIYPNSNCQYNVKTDKYRMPLFLNSSIGNKPLSYVNITDFQNNYFLWGFIFFIVCVVLLIVVIFIASAHKIEQWMNTRENQKRGFIRATPEKSMQISSVNQALQQQQQYEIKQKQIGNNHIQRYINDSKYRHHSENQQQAMIN